MFPNHPRILKSVSFYAPTSAAASDLMEDREMDDMEGAMEEGEEEEEALNADNRPSRIRRPSRSPSSSSWSARIDRFRQSKTAVAWVVALALFTDMIIYGTIIPLLPHITTPDKMGTLLACYAAGLLLVTPVVGVLSDKYGNRKVPMVCGLVGVVGATGGFAFARGDWDLALARMAQGVAGGISWTIGFCMLADTFAAEELGGVMGTVLGANTVGFLVGPPLSGFLFEYVHPKAPYAFCAVLALLDLGGRLFLKPPDCAGQLLQKSDDECELLGEEGTSSAGSHSVTTKVVGRKVGMLDLLKDWQVLCTCCTVAVGAAVFSGIEPTLPIYLQTHFNATPSQVGLIWIAIIIPNFLMGILTGHISDKHGRKNIAAVGTLLFGLATPFIALSSTIPTLILALCCFGAANAVLNTPALPEMADFVNAKGGGAYAQGYALFNMSFSVGMLVGPIVGTWIVE
ncbi:hypothetical protein HK104_000229, partial [Borealophlyctis nickersoniae]